MTFDDRDRAMMTLAIEASREAVAAGNMPFGAVLVAADRSEPLVARNDQLTTGDCTGHAETVLVREATRRFGAGSLRGGTVYASGEPCAMCCGALFWAGVSRVVFACPTPRIGEILGDPVLPLDSRGVLAGTRPEVRVDGPLLGDEAAAVIEAFVAGRATPS